MVYVFDKVLSLAVCLEKVLEEVLKISEECEDYLTAERRRL